jgi:hypothetical protein
MRPLKIRPRLGSLRDFQCIFRDKSIFDMQERTGVVIGKGELTSTQVENVEQEAV